MGLGSCMYLYSLAIAIISCFTATNLYAVDTYDITRAGNRYVPEVGDHYIDTIQPILAKRCAVCHACTSGPCQLNLTSFRGIERGLLQPNKERNTVTEDDVLARLDDGLETKKWRELGFKAIVGEHFSDNPRQSIFYRSLKHGQANNQSISDIRILTVKTDNDDFVCPATPQEYDEFEQKFPTGGMPFACPVLEDQYRQKLLDWVLAGAVGPSPQAEMSLSFPQTTVQTSSQSSPNALIAAIEAFFNRDALDRQAVSRYLFEHMYGFNLTLANNPGEFYHLVRSYTKAPNPIDPIVTEFVTEAPPKIGARVYYRLQKLQRVIELKRHIPKVLSLGFIDEMDQMFPRFELQALPDFTPNPFDWFHVIPAMYRARYVEKNAKNMMQVVARGAICHGRRPSYVSPDYAWFLMLKPEKDPTVIFPAFGRKNEHNSPDYKNFYWPAKEVIGDLSTLDDVDNPIGRIGDLLNRTGMFNDYRDSFKTFNEDFIELLERLNPDGLTLDSLSDQDLFWSTRHEKSLEYHSIRDRPLPGDTPYKILWSYAHYERFYYRTSVNFKSYGSDLHKAETFYTVIQMRSIGELAYSLLNPSLAKRIAFVENRNTLRGRLFYSLGLEFIELTNNMYHFDLFRQSPSFEEIALAIRYKYQNMTKPGVIDLNPWDGDDQEEPIPSIDSVADFEKALTVLVGNSYAGNFARFVPNIALIRLGGDKLYSLYVHRGHNDDKILTKEASARRPDKDRLAATRGLMGAFPGMFFDISLEQSHQFLSDLNRVTTEQEYINFTNTYGIRRNDSRMWSFLDWVHDWIGRNLGDEGALLDIRNYDIEDTPF